MSLERVVPLIVYVVCYFVLWSIAGLILRHGGGGELPLWLQQIAVLSLVAQLTVVLLVLGGALDPALLAVVALAYEVPFLVRAILVQLTRRSTFADEYWFGNVSGLRGSPRRATLWGQSVVARMIAVAASVLLPSAAYLLIPAGGPELIAWLLASQAAWLLVFQAATSMQSAEMLASLSVTSRARTLMLARQIAQVAPVAMWVAVLSWAFGITGPQSHVTIGGNVFSVSMTVLATVAVFVIAAVGPYVLGEWRRSRDRQLSTARQADLEESLLKIVMIPQRERFAEDLHQFGLRLNESQRELAEEAPLVKGLPKLTVSHADWASRLSRGSIRRWRASDARALERDLKDAYAERGAEDPRFEQWRRLVDLGDWTSELVQRSASVEPAVQVHALAKSVAEELQRRLSDETDLTVRRSTGKVPLIAALGFVASAIIGVVLDQFGEWIWDTAARSVSI
jgi:hypothetical protein